PRSSLLPGLSHLVGGCWIRRALERTIAIAAKVIGDAYQGATDVVAVIRFGELMALVPSHVLGERTVAIGVRRIWWIDLHLDVIGAWWDDWLAVADVENKVLPGQL